MRSNVAGIERMVTDMEKIILKVLLLAALKVLEKDV